MPYLPLEPLRISCEGLILSFATRARSGALHQPGFRLLQQVKEREKEERGWGEVIMDGAL
jgi:hypothetical protein